LCSTQSYFNVIPTTPTTWLRSFTPWRKLIIRVHRVLLRQYDRASPYIANWQNAFFDTQKNGNP
jgi:hypothetical protein